MFVDRDALSNPAASPLLRFDADMLYKLFIHCCAAVGKILTAIPRRTVRLR